MIVGQIFLLEPEIFPEEVFWGLGDFSADTPKSNPAQNNLTDNKQAHF
jgi:hypothetical protein